MRVVTLSQLEAVGLCEAVTVCHSQLRKGTQSILRLLFSSTPAQLSVTAIQHMALRGGSYLGRSTRHNGMRCSTSIQSVGALQSCSKLYTLAAFARVTAVAAAVVLSGKGHASQREMASTGLQISKWATIHVSLLYSLPGTPTAAQYKTATQLPRQYNTVVTTSIGLQEFKQGCRSSSKLARAVTTAVAVAGAVATVEAIT